MSRAFEELARTDTPPSLFTHGDEQLAELGLAAVTADRIDVVVGGLGLGYAACTVLQDDRVRTLHVVDTLDVVIDWHQRHLVPLGAELTGDPRCTVTHGDFFSLVDHDPPMLDSKASPSGPTIYPTPTSSQTCTVASPMPRLASSASGTS